MARQWAGPSPPAAATAAAAAVAAGLAYAPVAGHAAAVWWADPEFSFAFLVPPIAALLVVLRWPRIAAAGGTDTRVGLLGLAGGLAVLVMAARTDVNALAGASFLPVILGAVAFIRGIEAARLLGLPVAMVACALSLHRGLLSPVGFGLQQVTAAATAGVATVIGLPVERSGVDLFSGGVHLVVAESCSGMDSLLALLCLGGLFVGTAQAPPARRAALIALVLPIILAANVLRVTLVLLLAQPFGAAADGLGHQLLSASVFLVAALLFLAAGLALRCLPSFAVRASSPS